MFNNKEELIEYLNKGGKAKYIFFWGHRQKNINDIDKSCFSQWYTCNFEVKGVKYPSAEHFMMAEKAKLFNDFDTYKKIINAKSPGEAKQLGRKVRNFDDAKWNEERFEIVVRGNIAKFDQNIELKEFLLKTGNRILVEASPRDRIWGIGMDQNSEFAVNPRKWRGFNLLGFALIQARKKLDEAKY